MRKRVLTMLLIGALIHVTVIPAEARYDSLWYHSRACVTDEWTDFSDIIDLLSDIDRPRNDDVGMDLLVGNVGLPEAFIPSEYRVGEMTIMEQDVWPFNMDDTVCTYQGEFSVDETGMYAMHSFERVEDGSAYEIEDLPDLELYLSVRIGAVSGDLSYNIPYDLFRYLIWCE